MTYVMRLMLQKFRNELGWTPPETFETGIRKTVAMVFK